MRLALRFVLVLDPRDHLPLGVAGGVSHLDAGTHVPAVDAAEGWTPHQHGQHRLALGVGLVLGELRDQAQPRAARLVAPVAQLAGLPRRHQAVRFEGGGYRPRVAVEDDLHQLACARCLALYPAHDPRRDVALHAGDLRVGRSLVARVLGRHHVAGLAAELHGLHVLDGPVGELRSHGDVQHGRHAEDDRQASVGGCPVGDFGQEAPADPVPGEEDAHRDQGQPQEEGEGQDHEGEDADVGILGVSAHLQGQQEEPAEQRAQRDAHAQQAQPMARHHEDERPGLADGRSRGLGGSWDQS